MTPAESRAIRKAHPGIVERIEHWKDHPADMVRALFGIEPDAWQVDVLEAFPHNPRIAMLASKGVGKTAVESWLAWNFLLTRPFPKIAATSISEDNLKDGLWTEMAHWRNKSELLKATFTWTKERIFANEHPDTWWMSARTWPRSADPNRQADTLAGLHADYLLFLLDEVGGIPDAVMAAAEAGLASGVETHIVMGGNPTHLEGPLYRAATQERSEWFLVSVNGDPDNPKRSPRVSIEWARKQIAAYGRENPWVLVNVFGQFPPGSINSLLGPDDVNAALGRHLDVGAYHFAAKILGMDVALQGDDTSVIFPRQGLASFKPTILRNPDSMQLAGHLAQAMDAEEGDYAMVDATGGWGQGLLSAFRGLGRTAMEVQFGGKATSEGFLNLRAQMWWKMADWIKGGGALHPSCTDIVAELTQTTYSFRGDRIMIEPKDAVKAKIGRSPDMADALACTFAYDVPPKTVHMPRGFDLLAAQHASAYDPFAAVQ